MSAIQVSPGKIVGPFYLVDDQKNRTGHVGELELWAIWEDGTITGLSAQMYIKLPDSLHYPRARIPTIEDQDVETSN